MLKQLTSLFKRVDETDMQQRQREAMVDLLVWTMYADKVLALPENDRLDHMAEDLTWESTTPFSHYLNMSTAKVRDVLGNEDKAEELLNDISRRLETPAARQEAYDACCDLAQSDGEVVDEEVQFLNKLKSTLRV